MGLQKTPIMFGGMNDTLHPELLPENQTVFIRDLCTTGGITKLAPHKFCLSLPGELSGADTKIRWFTIWNRGKSRVVLFIDDATGFLYSFFWGQQIKAKNIKECSQVFYRDNNPVRCDPLETKITTAKSADQIWIFGARFVDGILCPIRYDGNKASLEYEVVTMGRTKEGAIAGVFFEERLILVSFARPNRLYWTDPNDFTQIPSDNWVDVYPYDNDTITGLLVYAGSIIVFKKHHIYRIVGIPPADVRIVSSKRGCPAGDGVVFNNIIYFRDNTGHLSATDGGDENIKDVSWGTLNNSMYKIDSPTLVCKQMLKEGSIENLEGVQIEDWKKIFPITTKKEERKIGCPYSFYGNKPITLVPPRTEFLVELSKMNVKGNEWEVEHYSNCSLTSFTVWLHLRETASWTSVSVRAKLVTGKEYTDYLNRLADTDETYFFSEIPGVESKNVFTIERGQEIPCTFTFEVPYAPMPDSELGKSPEGKVLPHAVLLSTYNPGTHSKEGDFTFSPISGRGNYNENNAPRILGGATKGLFGKVGEPYYGNYEEDPPVTHISTIETDATVIRWNAILTENELKNCLYPRRGSFIFNAHPQALDKLYATLTIFLTLPQRNIFQRVTPPLDDFGIVPYFSPTKINYYIVMSSPDIKAYYWECYGIECWVVEGDRDTYNILQSIHATPTGIFIPNSDPVTKTSELVRFDPGGGFSKITTGELKTPAQETALSTPLVKGIDVMEDLVVYTPASFKAGRAFVFFSDLDKTTRELTQKFQFEPFLQPQPMVISRQAPLTTLQQPFALPRRVIFRFSGADSFPYPNAVADGILDGSVRIALGDFVINTPQKTVGMVPQHSRTFGIKLRFRDIVTPTPLLHPDLVIMPAVIEWDTIGVPSGDDSTRPRRSMPPIITPGGSIPPITTPGEYV